MMYFKLYYDYSQEAFIYKCDKVSTRNKPTLPYLGGR